MKCKDDKITNRELKTRIVSAFHMPLQELLKYAQFIGCDEKENGEARIRFNIVGVNAKFLAVTNESNWFLSCYINSDDLLEIEDDEEYNAVMEDLFEQARTAVAMLKRFKLMYRMGIPIPEPN